MIKIKQDKKWNLRRKNKKWSNLKWPTLINVWSVYYEANLGLLDHKWHFERNCEEKEINGEENDGKREREKWDN